MVVDPCSTAPVACNTPLLQAPLVQQYIWMQFLCQIWTTLAGGGSCDLDTLLASASALTCQQSPQKLALLSMQQICSDLEGIECTQPCLTPLQIAAITNYLVCKIVNELA